MNLIYKPENNGKNIEEYDCHYLTGYTEGELVSFTGADYVRNSNRVVTISGIYPAVIVAVKCVDFQIRRQINFEEKSIRNELFRVNRKRTGLGSGIVNAQVDAATNAGFKLIKVLAIGRYDTIDKWNGYLTFAKLGFSMEEFEIDSFRKLLAKHGRIEQTINQLVSTEDGSKFWKENGYPWYGYFDLAENSVNRKILQTYIDKQL